MGTDIGSLSALLNTDVSKIEKPTVFPQAKYPGVIEKFETGETKEKKTPYIRIHVKLTGYPDTQDQEILDQCTKNPSGLKKYKDYYLNSEQMVFALRELFNSLFVDTSGKSIAYFLPLLAGRNVWVELRKGNSFDGKYEVNNVGDLVGTDKE